MARLRVALALLACVLVLALESRAQIIPSGGGGGSSGGTVTQGASASTTSAWPIMVTSPDDIAVRPGDAGNNAVRVNVVAGGAAGGTSSNFGTAFPTAGTASGFKGPQGGMASASVDNTDRLLVIVASAVTANAGTGTFTVSGTVTANAGTGNLNVRTTSDSTLSATVTQANATLFNATVTQGPAGTPWNARVTSDSTLTATVTQTTAANLNVRPDYSAATETLAPARVAMIGGLGASANAKNFVSCDEYASISTANAGNWRLVASETNKNVYVCGYTVVAAGPLAIKFVRGRGGNGAFDAACNTGSSDLTGAMSIAASGGIVNNNSPIPILKTAANDQLCINLSDGKQVSGHISFTQY